jgi:hypothetical protein
MKRFTWAAFVVSIILAGGAWAQGTGTITGTVRLADGEPLPGVSVSARSDVLPQARTTVTTQTGEYGHRRGSREGGNLLHHSHAGASGERCLPDEHDRAISR